jgi:hypothetical protein
MPALPPDPHHILKAKQAAAEQGLDLAPAFSALNIAADIYRELKPARQADDQARALRNMRKRVREMKAILADADIPDAKKVKKIRFLVNLLLPEAPPKP